MSKIGPGILHDFQNGETVTDQMLDVDNEIIRTAINDNYDQIVNHKNAAVLDHPDKSVTTAKLADSSVTSAKIANGAITSDKIANGAITADKVASGVLGDEYYTKAEIDNPARDHKGTWRGYTPQTLADTITGQSDFNAKYFGAVGDGVTDDTQAIKDALAACAATGGGTVRLPPGVYKITSTIAIPSSCELRGAGYRAVYGDISGPSVLKKSGNFVGVTLTDGSVLTDVHVQGDTGNGGDGIQLIGDRNIIESVVSSDHGGVGIRVGTNDGAACNLWRMINVASLNNNGDGIYIHDGAESPNVNAGSMIGADIRSNKGSGLVIENSIDCTFVAVAAQENLQKGIHLKSGARGHQFYGAYVELNQTGEFIIDAGADRNIIMGFRSGIVSTNIVNNGSANFILERDDQDESIPLINYGLNLNGLGITNHAISGVWRFKKNSATRDLEITLEGTGASPVYVRISHVDSAFGAKVGLSVDMLQVMEDILCKKITVDDQAVSGKWEISQNVDRGLDILLTETGATPVWANFVHVDDATGGLVGVRAGLLEIGHGETIQYFRRRQMTLDIPSTPARSVSEVSFTVNGAQLGDVVSLSPYGAPPAGFMWNAYVSAPNTVTARFYNTNSTEIDPTPQEWRVNVWAAESQ